jgi:uncharacterized protein (TIGR04255 family)
MAASIDKRSPPDYANPPVVETILGVQFDRLPAFRNAHLGAFWKSLAAEDWPTASDAPPLQPQFERFDEAARWGTPPQIQLTQVQAGRMQLTSQSGDRMIQLQNGRLHYNWMGQEADTYARYVNVRAGFEDALNRFLSFTKAEGVGEFRPNQWEITYLNHILKGTIWSTPADWNFFRPLAGVPSLEGVAKGESFNGEWHFIIPEKRGRLHIQWRHGVKSGEEEQEIIVLTLTARGPVGTADTAGVLDGIDAGHDAIVRAFATLMSTSANEYWGLKNASC